VPVQQTISGMNRLQLNFILSLVNTPVYSNSIRLNPLAMSMNQTNLHFTHEATIRNPEAFTECVSGLQVFSGKYSRTFIRYRFGSEPLVAQANSSWRKMYLTTPPITHMLINVPETHEKNFISRSYIRLHAPDGITLGMVCDRVEEELNKLKMKDARHPDLKKDRLTLTERDFIRSWGQTEHVMFIAENPEKDGSL
jgi:hypothetical protein